MADEWGPWTDHDHSGMPVAAGVVVQVAYPSGDEYVAEAVDGPWWTGGGLQRWQGKRGLWAPIIRYRLRRPPSIQRLVDLVEGVQGPKVREREDA